MLFTSDLMIFMNMWAKLKNQDVGAFIDLISFPRFHGIVVNCIYTVTRAMCGTVWCHYGYGSMDSNQW